MAMCIKLKVNTPFKTVISLLITYRIKMAALVHKDACTRMFTTALYEMQKHWKQSECPGKWQNKLWYIYTVAQYIILGEEC